LNDEPSLNIQEEELQLPLLPWRSRIPQSVEPEPENHDQLEEIEETWSEWDGFEDDNQPLNTTLLPPPINLYDSQELALQAIQKWAQSHGYALRIRSSRKRHKNDAFPYFIYLECDHGGQNQPTPMVNNNIRIRQSSTRRIRCPFRCILKQPVRESMAQWTVQYREAPHSTHNHGPSLLPTTHPIHRRNARNSRPEVLSQMQNNKLSGTSAKDTLSSLRTQFPDVPLTLTDVENVYQTVKAAMSNGLSAVQAMISKLRDSFQFHYVLNEADRLGEFFFS
jgi:hypothetical protein